MVPKRMAVSGMLSESLSGWPYQAWYPGTSVVDDPDGDIYYFDFEGRNVLEMKTISSRLTEFYRKISPECAENSSDPCVVCNRHLFLAGSDPVFLRYPAAEGRDMEQLAVGSGTVPYGLSGPHIPGALLSAFILCSSGRYLLISR